jgi:hypothetical protein
MSGSITWREYISDCGVAYSIAVDKSNAKLFNQFNGEAVCNPRGFNAPQLPIGLKPRLLYCVAQYNPKKKKILICGNRKIFDDNTAKGNFYLYSLDELGEPEGKIVWLITGYKGESCTLPYYYFQLDQGLTDGNINTQ